MSVPREMNAVTIDRFGGPELLQHVRRQTPEVAAGEVLIEVAYAGVGTWDPAEREGVFVELTGEPPAFPFTPGGDGAGTVAAVGAGVERFQAGDLVYALGGGFYAEYTAVHADVVSPVPESLELVQAGAMPVVALTALHGLIDELQVVAGETVMITGASGDTGHIAVQLAKRLGARVLAVASGTDGVEAARGLGADVAVDGRTVDIAAAAREFAPSGVDAVLALAGGPARATAIAAVREGGRAAYPLGVEPEPELAPHPDVRVQRFDLTLADPASIRLKMAKLNEMIGAGPFSVRIAGTFALDRAQEAQRALAEHRVGKIVLRVATAV